ncbi:hypothetical protein ACQE3E_22815 [Methylomonas sp. MED-D]|uniref:hypothetical protein n=1 Tax=unclassified Methylomonas TaxID=2608980 RepID=UPI0028A359F3|nr:hypothetical protein [Methylomonas sp. MV1]MDT4332805.1 hypothetical protein [Methylomonas sp. MV1]
MKRHLLSAALLLTALACYWAGYAGAGTIAFAVGGVFEAGFWYRILFGPMADKEKE